MSKKPATMSKKRAESALTGPAEKSSKKPKRQAALTGFFGGQSKASSSINELAASDESSTKLSAIGNPSSSLGYKIFCDLDGVLVDFDSGVKKLLNGRGPDELANPGIMWSAISRADAFYANLPWTKDGHRLWDSIKHTNPIILTGVPRTKKAIGDKAAWCKRELGVDVNHVDMAGKKSAHEVVAGRRKEGIVNVITCWSKNKHNESGERAVLIDDRSSFAEKWEEQGGIFIHHIDTDTTLRQLKSHGILSESSQATPEKAVYDLTSDTP